VPARYSLEDAYTLKIEQVQKSDDGMYGCNVQDYGSASANLTVLCKSLFDFLKLHVLSGVWIRFSIYLSIWQVVLNCYFLSQTTTGLEYRKGQ
jgi:hypothetical protein